MFGDTPSNAWDMVQMEHHQTEIAKYEWCYLFGR